MEAEETTTRSPSLVLQRNGVLTLLDNQRNPSATSSKGKKDHEHKHKEGKGEKETVKYLKPKLKTTQNKIHAAQIWRLQWNTNA